MGRMFEKRKATMFKRWDRMAKAFTAAGRLIAIAVKSGGDNPDYNPALRRAIQNARSVNMPKDKISNAIKKASGADAKDYAIVMYEGYGPNGVALLVETATDNPTRTVANVRLAFRKSNGNMGNSGSVIFMFNHQGVFTLKPTDDMDPEELELDLIDHGLEELVQDEDDEGAPIFVIRSDFGSFGSVAAALEERGITPTKAETEYVPTTLSELTEEQETEVLALIDRLEQDDDVTRVFHTLP
jgi:YebC/PmpR family DNA-binding regulatory protein